MSLRDRLATHGGRFDAVLAVATCRNSLGFIDLWFPPFDFEAEHRRLIENRDPGVVFENDSLVLVIEEYGGELRYFAGGRADVYNQPHEVGVFRVEEDAMKYAEAFFVQRLHPECIEVRRGIMSEAYYWGRDQ